MINCDMLLCIFLVGCFGNFGICFYNYLYDKLGLNYFYKVFMIKDIEVVVKGVCVLGICGCVVFMLFKESCILFFDVIDLLVKVIDFVNIIVNDDGKLIGLNIDYIVVKSLIVSYWFDINVRVMIQGSGGMGKVVIVVFCDVGFCDVIIVVCNCQCGLVLVKQYGFQWQFLFEGIVVEILVNVILLGMVGGVESNMLVFSEVMVVQVSVVFDVVVLLVEILLICLV